MSAAWELHNIFCWSSITLPCCSHCQEAVELHSILLQPPACSPRPRRLLVHWQGTSALAHLRTGDPSQMEEAAPMGVHALSFASLAHKSFIKDVSFAYTEGRQSPSGSGWNTGTKAFLQLCLVCMSACLCEREKVSWGYVKCNCFDLIWSVFTPKCAYHVLQHVHHTNGSTHSDANE